MSTHPCPRCGQPTAGAYSEGGLRWAICDDCMNRESETRRPDPTRYADAIKNGAGWKEPTR